MDRAYSLRCYLRELRDGTERATLCLVPGGGRVCHSAGPIRRAERFRVVPMAEYPSTSCAGRDFLLALPVPSFRPSSSGPAADHASRDCLRSVAGLRIVFHCRAAISGLEGPHV